MKTSQNRVLASFQRVQAFLDTNTSVLGTIPQSAPRLALDGIVTSLLTNGSAQDLSKKQTTSAVNTAAALRDVLLRDHMRPIATIAKDQGSTLTQVSGLKMPKAKITNGNLVLAANSMATEAATYAQTFTNNGLPSDFIAQLQAAATALDGALTIKGTLKTNSILATTNVADQERQGRLKLKVINAQVQSALAGNPGLLAQWDNTKRVTPQKSSGTATPAPSPAPSPSTSSPAPSLPAVARPDHAEVTAA